MEPALDDSDRDVSVGDSDSVVAAFIEARVNDPVSTGEADGNAREFEMNRPLVGKV